LADSETAQRRAEMEHTPIKLDYAGFQAARDSKLMEETVLTKYLGKNWAENVGQPRPIPRV